MKITYYGHSCFGIALESGKHLLFDPFISGNELAKEVQLDTIPADYILPSHAHADHIGDLIPIAKRTNATVIAIWEIYSWALAQGIQNAHPMNIGGSWQFDFGKVKMVEAVHSSSFPDGSYGGNPAGFVIEADKKRFYYAGDTALHFNMQLLSGRYLDFAFLPIGSNFTMDVEDAIQASNMINCNKIIGMHYDTFGFIKIDHQAAQEAFSAAGKEL
ncbi:MAG: metal-dependent hydrolase, partial [Bacteroidia bacterium]|nr:metal-dependent hydrolase [Bacteroidia bacterium]